MRRKRGATRAPLRPAAPPSAPRRAPHLLPHAVHEVGPGDALGEAREVLNLCGPHELAAAPVLEALEHDGLQVGARRVDCGGVARGAGADDGDVLHVWGAGAAGRRREARRRRGGAAGPSRRPGTARAACGAQRARARMRRARAPPRRAAAGAPALPAGSSWAWDAPQRPRRAALEPRAPGGARPPTASCGPPPPNLRSSRCLPPWRRGCGQSSGRTAPLGRRTAQRGPQRSGRARAGARRRPAAPRASAARREARPGAVGPAGRSGPACCWRGAAWLCCARAGAHGGRL
jgi:hypothetical protein